MKYSSEGSGFLKGKIKRVIKKRLNNSKDSLPIFVKQMVTSIMQLEIPRKILNLGDNVPKFSRFHKFPPFLRIIENSDLKQTIERFDENINSLKASNAEDWADLTDRLGYIVDLFRTTQNTKNMFYPTFTKKQRKEIYKDVIPDGPL